MPASQTLVCGNMKMAERVRDCETSASAIEILRNQDGCCVLAVHQQRDRLRIREVGVRDVDSVASRDLRHIDRKLPFKSAPL